MQAARWKWLVATAFLAACSSAPEKAAREYDLVKKTGDKAAICAAAGKVTAAWLKAEDEQEYRLARATEGNDCQDARNDIAEPDKF